MSSSAPENRTEANDAEELLQIADFKRGFLEGLELQQSLARKAQQLLYAPVFGPEERKKLQDDRGPMDKALADALSLGRQLASNMNQGTLDKEAYRDYHNVFASAGEDAHRLSFVRFLKIYVLLKRYAADTRERWMILKNALKRAELSPKSEFLKQLRDFHVEPALRHADAIDTLCRRMGAVLQLQRDPLTARSLDGAALYSPEIEYQLSTVFIENLDAEVRKVFARAGRDPSQLPEAKLPGNAGAASIEPAPEPAESGMHWRLDASGRMEWNSTSHYFFQYNPAQLEQERRSFKDVVYIDTHMGADQQFIKSDFIRNYSRKKRKDSDVSQVESDYSDFLEAFFQMVTDLSLLNMQIPASDRMLFVFHLGPQTFFNLTVRFLQELGTGAMHRRLPNRQVIRKFIPTELVRKNILEWWRDEVLPATSSRRDDYADYRKLVSAVKKTHGRLSQYALEQYAALPEQEKRGRTREDVMRERITEWMGATNIITFKRFLKPRQ